MKIESKNKLNLLVFAFEKQLICRALDRSCGNVALASKLLGAPHTSVWSKIKKHKINANEFVPNKMDLE